MDKRISDPRKIGFLKWETDVTVGPTLFTFVGFTKAGATQKAAQFVMDTAQDRSN